jgi:WD40 repeat protein
LPLKCTIDAPDGFAKDALFSSDGKKIIASGGSDMRPIPPDKVRPTDHTIRVWDIASGKELRCLRGHTSGVIGLALSPDGKTLASCSHDRTIRLWPVPWLAR